MLGVIVSCILYADAVILLFASLTMLQDMLYIVDRTASGRPNGKR